MRTQDLRTEDGVRITLHLIGDPQAQSVLLVPGTFSNSTFWLGTKGVGFGRVLADAGYYVCVLDPRGHGHSDRPTRNDKWDIDDWARHDVTTAIRAIATPDKPAIVIGHSAGGAVLLAALSAEPELRTFVKTIVAVGTPLPWLQPWRTVGAWAIKHFSLLLGRFPAKLIGIGPEDELPRVMSQWMTWNLKGHWRGDDGVDYTAGLKDLHQPCLMIAGTHDRLFAPPRACRGLYDLIGSDRKEFEVFKGLGHVSILVSRQAQSTVWPRILHFLATQ